MVQSTRRQFGKLVASLAVPAAALPALSRPAIAQGAKEVVTFAGVTFSEAGRGEKLRAWVETFNKSQDKIEVQSIGMPFSTFANTVFTQMGGGAGPDVLRLDLIDYHAAIGANRILPLDEILAGGGYHFGAPDKYMIVGGKRYGVAFESSNYVLLYSKALIKAAPPATFDDFLKAAKEATGDGNYGFGFRATMAERPGFWQDICNFAYGFGGRFSDGRNLTLNAPGVIEGVAAYKRVYDSGAIPKGADASTYRRMFWEGKLAMEIDNGGVAAILHQQAPALQLAASPSPFPTRAQGVSLAPLTINANTKNKAAAVAFFKWTLEPGPQRELQGILGASNVATIVDRTPAELEQQPWLRVYDDQTPNSLPQLVEGFEVKTPEIQQIVLEQVLRVLQAGQAPKQAMDDAQRQAASRVKR